MKIMNEKLIVKNFGPIKNAELDLKKVTIFIGPQGSGKSTLAKLVAIFKEDVFKKDSIIQNLKDYGIHNFIKKESTNIYFQSDLSIVKFNDEYIQEFKELGNSLMIKIEELNIKINRFMSMSHNITTGIDEISNINIEYDKIMKEYKIKMPIYIPERRTSISFLSSSLFGLMNKDINLPKTLTEFGNRYSKASTNDSEDDARFVRKDSPIKENNKTKHIELFDLQFQHRDGQDFLIDTKNNYEVNLRDSASGMQSSIPLILVVRHEYSAGNKHFIIEEPELNLFPTTQKQLVGYLADKCTQNGNELLMTTHSPYVLSAINNLIFAFQVAQVLPERADEIAQIIPQEQWLNPDDVAAYYVGEDENGEKGGIHSIFNKKTGLIGENELDEVSDELGDEFNALMSIYRTRKRETVN